VPAFPLPGHSDRAAAVSGFTAHNAQTAIRRDAAPLVGWLIVTVLLGVGFPGGQAYEYLNLIRVDQFTISSGIYGSVFYSLTGLHGLHAPRRDPLTVMIRGFMGHFSSRATSASRHSAVLALRRCRGSRCTSLSTSEIQTDPPLILPLVGIGVAYAIGYRRFALRHTDERYRTRASLFILGTRRS
jgi:hypothetical protein